MKTYKKPSIVEKILFGSKWMLIPFYLGLMVALAIYTFVDVRQVYEMVVSISAMDEERSMMMLLKLVDIAMIANLVKMIIVGSYTSFVDKNHGQDGEKTSSGVLKVKMTTSLIGVSSINLLQTFIHAKDCSNETLYKQLIIHSVFLIGAVMLAFIDYLHVKSEVIHDNSEPNKHH
jgi:uncharacterized protein (TIGR00645 family)